MNGILGHMRAATVLALLLAIAAGDLGAQSATRKKRGHRMFAAQTGPDEVSLAWDEVPGATEYRVYLPNPASPGPPTAATRPWLTGSGSSRRAVVVGIRKLAAGAYLEALAGRRVLFRGTFAPVTRAPLAPPAAPNAVAAAETGETEVTVSWDAVPGATAYRLGRAVGGSGFAMLCDLCPPEPEFVDTAATPGLDHTYTVEAIFPLGHSERVISEPVTVGAAQLAAATAAAAAAAPAWDKPMASGTPVPGTAADNSNTGAAGGTVTPTGGTTTPTTGGSTPTASCPPGTVPITAQPKTTLQPAWNKPMASGTPVGGTAADNSNTGASAGTTNTGSTGTPPAGCVPVTPSQPTGTPGYTPPGTPAGTTSTYTPPGTPAGTTSTYTPPGAPAGSTSTYTPPGTPASTLPAAGTPAPATPATADYFNALVARIQDNLTYLLGSVATAGTAVHAATPVTASNDQLASWVGTIKGNLSELLGSISSQLAAGGSITHAATPAGATSSTTTDPLVSLAFGMRDRVSNLLQAVGAGTFAPSGAVAGSPFGGLAGRIRGDVGELLGSMGLDPMAGASTTVHAATPITTTPPATSTPAPTACRLDYQRADNMWAAFGRADGQLGTESISLAPGQSRVFVTDWKYEKVRNDGTNFYGSHLRIATNRTSQPVRLQLRTTTLTGLVIFARTGSDTFWIRLDPNASKQLQADLMEVHCEF